MQTISSLLGGSVDLRSDCDVSERVGDCHRKPYKTLRECPIACGVYCGKYFNQAFSTSIRPSAEKGTTSRFPFRLTLESNWKVVKRLPTIV